jgi:hypothetical protein
MNLRLRAIEIPRHAVPSNDTASDQLLNELIGPSVIPYRHFKIVIDVFRVVPSWLKLDLR